MLSYISDNRVYEVLSSMRKCQPCVTNCCQPLASVSSDELAVIQSLGLIEQTEAGWVVNEESANHWITEYEEEHAFHKTAVAYWILVALLLLNFVVMVLK